MFAGLTAKILDWTERGRLPDPLLRLGCRLLLAQRLREESAGHCETLGRSLESFIETMDRSPVAPVPGKANEQHYEIPPAFFAAVLGARRKYSSCHWRRGVRSLDQAEEDALGITCERAELANGQEVLELGCGWGSLTLWMAERYPEARITAVSNSAPQRAHIEEQARRRGLPNVRVITADMNAFDTADRYDRVVSVEMFEHMRNWRELLRRVAGWLRPGGKAFVHVFCHRSAAYAFETEGAANWLGRHFFTGGIMPSDHLIHRFQDDLLLERHWRWEGTHYRKTADAWLGNLDRRREIVMPILRETYGEADAERWFHRWRLFFIACSELFGHRRGQEWWVAHYLLRKR